MVQWEEYTMQLEEEGKITTQVIGLAYVGSNSTASPTRARTRGAWPGVSVFQRALAPAEQPVGRDALPDTARSDVSPDWVPEDMDLIPSRIQIGITPDLLDDGIEGGTLDDLELLKDFQVIYDPAVLAEALMYRNYLPKDIFGERGGSYDKRIREPVFERLGIEDAGLLPEAEEEYREQLAEIAGVEYDPAEQRDVSFEGELRREVTRPQALEAAEELGVDVDETTPKNEAIAAVADHEERTAREALRDAGAEV